MRLDNDGLFVYVRHGSNAWREYAPGSFLHPRGWRIIDRPLDFTSTHLSHYVAAARTLFETPNCEQTHNQDTVPTSA